MDENTPQHIWACESLRKLIDTSQTILAGLEWRAEHNSSLALSDIEGFQTAITRFSNESIDALIALVNYLRNEK